MYHDRIDLTLPETDLQSVLTALASVGATLKPLPSVSLADRKRLAKLGLKNEALALQIIEVGRSNPELIPRGIDFQRIDRDLVAREQLRSLKILLEGLLGKVNDSMLLTGVDLYAAALSIYHCLRRHGDSGGLKDTVEELKRGFARPSRKRKEQEQEVAPAAAPLSAPLSSVNPPHPEPRRSAEPKNTPVAIEGQTQPLSSSPKLPQPRVSNPFRFPLSDLSHPFSNWSTPPTTLMPPELIPYHVVGFWSSTAREAM